MGEYIFHYPLPQVSVSCLSGTRRWTEPVWQLSDRPRHPFGSLTLILGRNPTLAGRGGSVSRRDHNQAHWRATALSGGTNYAEATNSNASRFPGGSAREGPFSERPPPSHSSHRFHASGGGPGEGKDSHSRQWRLSMAVFLNRNKRPQAAPIEVAELLSEKPPPSQLSLSIFLRYV